MHTNHIVCKATVDGKVEFTAALCHVNQMVGGLLIEFDKPVALKGSRQRVFYRPGFVLKPFTPPLLTQVSAEGMAGGTTLEMAGTDIGYWVVRHDPRDSSSEKYPLKSASVRKTYYGDGIGLEIESDTCSGVNENWGKVSARDLPPAALSISIFVPASELGFFLLPGENAVLSMNERLSKLPTHAT